MTDLLQEVGVLAGSYVQVLACLQCLVCFLDLHTTPSQPKPVIFLSPNLGLAGVAGGGEGGVARRRMGVKAISRRRGKSSQTILLWTVTKCMQGVKQLPS